MHTLTPAANVAAQLNAQPVVPEGATVSAAALSLWRVMRAATPAGVMAMAGQHPDCAWTRDAMQGKGAEVHPEPRLCWVEGDGTLWPAAVLRVTFEGETRRVVVSPRLDGGHFVQTIPCNHDAGVWFSVA